MYKQILVDKCISVGATVVHYLINAEIMDHIKSLTIKKTNHMVQKFMTTNMSAHDNLHTH
jgi:hypothetical protein